MKRESMPGSRPSFLWIVLVFTALCIPLVLSSRRSNYSFDEAAYYLPAVRQIRAHWPALDLRRDSLTATAPGYPYLLATLSLTTGANRLPLRMATFAVSLALLGLLWLCFPAVNKPSALAAVLVLACSNFYVKSAAWVVTDNAALLAMTGALACAFFWAAPRSAGYAGLLAAVATFIRQNYAWMALPVAWHAWRKLAARPSRAGWLLSWAPLAPVAVLGMLIHAWGGVAPPDWQEAHYAHGITLVMPLVYVFSVLGCFGGFFYFAVAGANWRADCLSRWALAGAGFGLAMALIGPTSYSVSAGRWGGYFWMLAARLPAPVDRSVVFLILAPLGGAIAGILVRRLRAESGTAMAAIWICACASWGLSQLPNRQVFHRYYEPPVIILLIFWVLLILRARPAGQATRWSPLGALAAGQFALTLATVHYQVFCGSLLP